MTVIKRTIRTFFPKMAAHLVCRWEVSGQLLLHQPERHGRAAKQKPLLKNRHVKKHFCGLMKPRELFVSYSEKPVWRKSGAGTKRQARVLRTLEWAQGSASNERMTHRCLRNGHVSATCVTIMILIHYIIQHQEEVLYQLQN